MSQSAFIDSSDESAGSGNFLAKIPTILWQRRWLVLVPLAIGSLAAIAAMLLLPTTYRSSAVILVQSPQLSNEVLGENPSDNVDRRIARIREQITSRPDLLALIERHGLYQSERSRSPLSSVVKKMRKAIVLTPTVADGPADPSKDNTISFALTFDYSRPAEAQAVTQDLMERLLSLDSSLSSTQATNAVQFLGDQASTLQRQIAEIEAQVAGVSARNGRALAGPTTMMGGGGASYDVQISALQRDNATLLAQRQAAKSGDSRDPLVAAAEAQYASAKAIFSDNHPDVIQARQRLTEARAQVRGNASASLGQQIDQQIAFNNAQIASLRAGKSSESAQVSAALSASARGPLAQQQIAQLQQRLTGLNTQFQSVSDRLLAARAGVRADNEQMGQRLSVIEPPVVPDTPYSPNVWLLAALGIVGGLGLGLVLAMLVEFIIRPIRDPAELIAFDGAPPLGIIPQIKPSGAHGRTRPASFWQRLRPGAGRRHSGQGA